MELKSIGQLVREMEQLDQNGTTTSSKYVSSSMREDINKTEAYINSKHISGSTDHLDRKKPFFNIVMATRNVWYRATDIDRKNINIRATKIGQVINSFLATIKLQEWMKTSRFGQFLNDWGLTLATHGSAIAKFIEKGGKLNCQVIDWNNILVDAVDFDNNIKVEKLWFTPAQLKKQKGYNQKIVEQLLSTLSSRETIDGDQKDTKSDYIPLYEVHGELPLYYKTGKESDKEVYKQMMFVITFQAHDIEKKDFEDYVLYSGLERKDPYHLSHLIKKDGQTYAGGAVKNLFEAQWMVNHSQKMIKDQLDLASKIIFQSSDNSLSGNNVLTNIENGQILNHKQNEPLTQLNNRPDIAAMQSFQASWQSIAAQINGISEAMLGENPPSGTAWRQTQALLQESHSLFELMTENKGLAIEEMLREYILPFFRKQLNNSDEISSILEENQIKMIDSIYIPNEAKRMVNKKIKQTILSGQIYDTEMKAQDMQEATGMIQETLQGNQRFIKPSEVSSKTWKEVLSDVDFEKGLEIDITGEIKDVQGALATLSTVLQTVISNPAILQNENVKMVFNKILSLTGTVSPMELTQSQAPVPQSTTAAVGGQVPMMQPT